MMNESFFRNLFRFAAFYNITVGTAVVLFPQMFFRLFNLPEINHPYVMSGLGMFVAVYGYGFYLVSLDLRRNYQFAVLGLVGKSFGVIEWCYHASLGVIRFRHCEQTSSMISSGFRCLSPISAGDQKFHRNNSLCFFG